MTGHENKLTSLFFQRAISWSYHFLIVSLPINWSLIRMISCSRSFCIKLLFVLIYLILLLWVCIEVHLWRLWNFRQDGRVWYSVANCRCLNTKIGRAHV